MFSIFHDELNETEQTSGNSSTDGHFSFGSLVAKSKTDTYSSFKSNQEVSSEFSYEVSLENSIESKLDAQHLKPYSSKNLSDKKMKYEDNLNINVESHSQLNPILGTEENLRNKYDCTSIQNLNIVNFRQHIDCMTKDCVIKHINERERILSLAQSRKFGSEIFKKRFENLCQQQNEFDNFVNSLKVQYTICNHSEDDSSVTESIAKTVQKESEIFKQLFPAYGFRNQILNNIKESQVTIIHADFAYAFNIALPPILYNIYINHSIVSCEANSILRDVVQNKIDSFFPFQREDYEKSFYRYLSVLSEQQLLNLLSSNNSFSESSCCIILNVSLKRSIIMDILLANLRDFLGLHKNSKLVLLLSHCDSASKFKNYFSQKVNCSLLNIPRLVFPVKTMWKDVFSSPSDDFTDDVVATIIAVHVLNKLNDGNIIVFLPSDADVKFVFAKLEAKLLHFQYNNLEVFPSEIASLNEFLKNSSANRKVFLLTNDNEGLIIPSVSYMIDCGMQKDYCYDSKTDINVVNQAFISQSRAKMRKDLVGVYDTGTCIRIYNKRNYQEMYVKEHAEIFCINPIHSMIKVLQHRPNTSQIIQFVETLPEKIQSNTLNLLKNYGAVDKDLCLTKFGDDLIKLPFPSNQSRFILLGLQWGLPYEVVTLLAFFSIKKEIFVESTDDDHQKSIDAVKLDFNHLDSDTLSYLNIFKTWKENGFKKAWCNTHYINFLTMKSIRSKVNEICCIIRNCLGKNIEEQFSETIAYQDLIQILFQSFQNNLCVFTGHPRIGYQILASSQLASVHPSSFLLQKETFPQFVIYDELSEHNFMMNLTSIPFKLIMEFLQNNLINFSHSDLFDEKLSKKVIEPVGEKVIAQVLLKNEGKKVKKIEDNIKKETGAEVVLIEPVLGKGCVILYAFPSDINKCLTILEKILRDHTQALSNAEETKTIELKKGQNVVAVEIKLGKGAQTASVRHTFNVRPISNQNSLHSVEIAADSEHSSINYSLKLFWPRRICSGEGSIKFTNKKDFDRARRLALKFISVAEAEAEVFVQVGNVKAYELHISEIPPDITEENIVYSFKHLLPECEFHVELYYLPAFETSAKELVEIKKQIEDNCKHFTNILNFEVWLSNPELSSNYMNAYVNVFEERSLDIEARNLSLTKVNNIKTSCQPLYFSNVKCNAEIYKVLKYRVQEELKNFEDEQIKKFNNKFPFKVAIEKKAHSEDVTIKLSSKNIEIMKALQMVMNNLLDGVKLDKNNLKDIHKLFCHGGHVFLKTLERTESVYIMENFETKTIRLYGLQKNCDYARQSIRSFLEDTENEVVKNIILSNDKHNRTVLKEIIREYGVNLEKFIEMYELRSAALDIKTSCLSLYGKKDNVKMAEECLKELCTNFDSSNICSDFSVEEICPVCSCPAENLTYRVELCGHLYCSECIQGLIKQAIFPIQCCAENCSKDIVLGDIKYVLDDDEDEINNLVDKSLKDYLERNKERIFHCPAADCCMFVFRSEIRENKWKCSLCKNFICIACNVVFHEGFSCDMYRGSKADPDYSFKVYQNTNSQCKRCPTCKTAIEKRDGCNHMTCQSCRGHFCWICLMAFPTGNDVYNHIARTHINQLFAVNV